MNDDSGFSSATLLGLSIAVLRDIDPGILPAEVDAPDWRGQARVDAAQKRRVLDFALGAGGPGPLLRVGSVVESLPPLPPLQVLMLAPTPASLAERWMRLERYSHSHNRTRIVADRDRWTCSRYALGTRPPGPAENLVICSLLAGLLRRFGCEGVIATMDDGPVLPLPPRSLPERTDRWILGWSAHREVRGEGPFPTGAGKTAEEADGDAATGFAGRAGEVMQVLAEDIARPWRVSEVARRVGVSPRSLQRELARTGSRFSVLQRSARVRRACRHLLHDPWSLADIGYASGFSDQAHFQREFRRVVGMTPSEYRRLSE